MDKFGWTTSIALGEKEISMNVCMLAGEFTTVDIMKTSLSHASATQLVMNIILQFLLDNLN